MYYWDLYQLVLRNDATAAISISSMEGLLRRVRHIELRARYIQMLVKRRRLILGTDSRVGKS